VNSEVLQRFTRNVSGVIAGIYLLILLAIGIGVSFWNIDPTMISANVMRPPSMEFPLGTDDLGRDMVTSLMFGVQISLLVGICGALGATVIGIIVGSLAGYLGGLIDKLLTRLTEFFQIMPSFIIAAVIVAMSGAGLSRITAVIALLAWPQIARVTRSQVLRVKELEFVDAARCLGKKEMRILMREVLPNALAPAIALGTLTIGQAILLEASLSFFGLSSAESMSWGRALNSGQRFLFNAWWMSVFPGAAIFLTVLAFNIFGDAVSGALNPRRSQ